MTITKNAPVALLELNTSAKPKNNTFNSLLTVEPENNTLISISTKRRSPAEYARMKDNQIKKNYNNLPKSLKGFVDERHYRWDGVTNTIADKGEGNTLEYVNKNLFRLGKKIIFREGTKDESSMINTNMEVTILSNKIQIKVRDFNSKNNNMVTLKSIDIRNATVEFNGVTSEEIMIVKNGKGRSIAELAKEVLPENNVLDFIKNLLPSFSR